MSTANRTVAYPLHTRPATKLGWSIGEMVEFQEHIGLNVYLKGKGIIIGWTDHPAGPFMISPFKMEKGSADSPAFKNFVSDSRPARPFRGSEIKKLAGGAAPTLISDEIMGPYQRSAAMPFRVGDLVERLNYSHPSYGQRWQHYSVLAVNSDGDIRVIEDGLFGSKDNYTLLRKAEHIASEKLFHSFAATAFSIPATLPKNNPETAKPEPTATASKPMKYRVVSADGVTSSSRTWDKLEDALKDAEKRADVDENYREFQVVAVVATAKAEKLKVITYKRGHVSVSRK